jgi:multisubunit Na+/H+ antiporter MnhC subunit
LRTINSQRQEQKTIVEGIASQQTGVSDVPRFIFMGILLAILVGIGVWKITSPDMHIILLSVLAVIIGVRLFMVSHGLYHELYVSHYERRKAKKESHFLLVGDMVIGDETTQGYRLFHPLMGEVRQEFEQPLSTTVEENIQPSFTSQEMVDEIIRREKFEGATMQQIVQRHSDVTMHDVRKALGKTGK